MEDSSRPVFLVGFMGAGKTTVGALLARHLGREFFDLDAHIAEQEGRSIGQIFTESGEAYFRELELKTLETLRGRTGLVVACGGGSYASDRGRSLIDRLGLTVWLDVSLAVGVARCRGEWHRPLLADAAATRRLYDARRSSYALAAHRIDGTRLTARQAATRIASLIAAEGQGP